MEKLHYINTPHLSRVVILATPACSASPVGLCDGRSQWHGPD